MRITTLHVVLDDLHKHHLISGFNSFSWTRKQDRLLFHMITYFQLKPICSYNQTNTIHCETKATVSRNSIDLTPLNHQPCTTRPSNQQKEDS